MIVMVKIVEYNPQLHADWADKMKLEPVPVWANLKDLVFAAATEERKISQPEKPLSRRQHRKRKRMSEKQQAQMEMQKDLANNNNGHASISTTSANSTAPSNVEGNDDDRDDVDDVDDGEDGDDDDETADNNTQAVNGSVNSKVNDRASASSNQSDETKGN
jgi:hypothetical protein